MTPATALAVLLLLAQPGTVQLAAPVAETKDLSMDEALSKFVRAQRMRRLVLAGAGLALLFVFVSSGSPTAAVLWFLCAASFVYAYFQAISLGAACVETFILLAIAKNPSQVLTSQALAKASGDVIDEFTWFDPVLRKMEREGVLVVVDANCCRYRYAKVYDA